MISISAEIDVWMVSQSSAESLVGLVRMLSFCKERWLHAGQATITVISPSKLPRQAIPSNNQSAVTLFVSAVYQSFGSHWLCWSLTLLVTDPLGTIGCYYNLPQPPEERTPIPEYAHTSHISSNLLAAWLIIALYLGQLPESSTCTHVSPALPRPARLLCETGREAPSNKLPWIIRV